MTARKFGMTSRQLVGGNQAGGSHYSADTRADFYPMPPGSILSASPTLERGDIAQALIDVAAALGILALCSLVLGSVAAGIFILVFVRF